MVKSTRIKYFLASCALVISGMALAGCTEEEKNEMNEIVELEFFQSKNELKDAYEKIIDLFEEENPYIRINQVSPADAETVLMTRIVTNDIPDMMSVFPLEEIYKEIEKNGLLLDIKDEEFVKNTEDEVVEMAMYNGGLYCMPYAMSTYGIFCNREMFRKAGLEFPETYEELRECCESFYNQGITPMVFADGEIATVNVDAERCLGIIKNNVYEDLEKIGKGEGGEQEKEPLRMMAESMLELRSYSYDNMLSLGRNEAVAGFAEGRYPMYRSGTYSCPAIRRLAPEMDMVMVPMPNPTGEETKLPINIDIAIGISSGTEYPKEAKKFLGFCSREEIFQILADEEVALSMLKKCGRMTDEMREVREMVLDEDRTFRMLLNYLPPGMNNTWSIYTQQLVTDKDIDKFIENTEKVCGQYYGE